MNTAFAAKKALFCLLAIVLLAMVTEAATCEVEDIEAKLRTALYEYFLDSNDTQITLPELKDLLVFYSVVSEEQVADCTSEIITISKINESRKKIPTCSDGTPYGKCSESKPLYCFAGDLVEKCAKCGCPEGYWCDTSSGGSISQCLPVEQNITCGSDSDCGENGFIGNYYCQNGDVYRDYLTFNCTNPGTVDSFCANQSSPLLIDDCEGADVCIEGMSSCQTTPLSGTLSPVNHAIDPGDGLRISLNKNTTYTVTMSDSSLSLGSAVLDRVFMWAGPPTYDWEYNFLLEEDVPMTFTTATDEQSGSPAEIIVFVVDWSAHLFDNSGSATITVQEHGGEIVNYTLDPVNHAIDPGEGLRIGLDKASTYRVTMSDSSLSLGSTLLDRVFMWAGPPTYDWEYNFLLQENSPLTFSTATDQQSGSPAEIIVFVVDWGAHLFDNSGSAQVTVEKIG